MNKMSVGILERKQLISFGSKQWLYAPASFLAVRVFCSRCSCIVFDLLACARTLYVICTRVVPLLIYHFQLRSLGVFACIYVKYTNRHQPINYNFILFYFFFGYFSFFPATRRCRCQIEQIN